MVTMFKSSSMLLSCTLLSIFHVDCHGCGYASEGLPIDFRADAKLGSDVVSLSALEPTESHRTTSQQRVFADMRTVAVSLCIANDGRIALPLWIVMKW
jgi:hypothetical protein